MIKFVKFAIFSVLALAGSTEVSIKPINLEEFNKVHNTNLTLESFSLRALLDTKLTKAESGALRQLNKTIKIAKMFIGKTSNECWLNMADVVGSFSTMTEKDTFKETSIRACKFSQTCVQQILGNLKKSATEERTINFLNIEIPASDLFDGFGQIFEYFCESIPFIYDDSDQDSG